MYNVYTYFKHLLNSKPNATVKELFRQIQTATADAADRAPDLLPKQKEMQLQSQKVCQYFSHLRKLSRKNLTELDDFVKSIVWQNVQES